ncbi:MAG: hypothetical protein EGR51_01875 [Oscillibacter sp.]|nr:hypothetical protein [Oscillibacter sp.]
MERVRTTWTQRDLPDMPQPWSKAVIQADYQSLLTAQKYLLDRWPKDEAGAPEPAAKLDIQWELDSQADITVSFLESCGIPAFQNGSLGKVLGGFASQGVEIWVPASQLEEAQALLDTPAEIPEQD